MGMRAEDALAQAKAYVKKTLQGMGALKGQDGKSAYQVALDNGFDGTEEEWLESLKGADGTGAVKVSEKEGNIIIQESDGLYATGGGEEPLIVEMRFDVGTPNCTVTSLSETYQTIYEALRTGRDVVVKGYNNSARTDAPLWFYPIGYIANSNMATFQCVYQYLENNITAYYLQITSVNNNLSYNTYDMAGQDLSEYQKLLEGTEGQLVGFNADGEAVAVNKNLTYAGFTTTSVTDMDNLKEPGSYSFSSAITNCPSGIDRFKADVFTWYRYVVQIVFGFKASTTASQTNSVPTFYIRMYDTMLYTWTAWNLVSARVAMDAALSSTSTNPVQNKAIYIALTNKQDKLVGTENQIVGFDTDGKAVVVDDTPAFGNAFGTTGNDERIEISTTSLVIKQKFRRAKLTLQNTLPSNYSNQGGPVAVDIFRLADGTYKSTTTCSPAIYASAANKITIMNWTVQATVTELEDGTFKITASSGGAIYTLDLTNGTMTNGGSGSGTGNFNNILVWF